MMYSRYNVASDISISKTSVFKRNCKTAVIITDPPGDPVAIIGFESLKL